MENYLKAVTLGAFTWRDKERIALLFKCIRKQGAFWLLLHFLLVTVCLNFPVTLSVARLSPFELYSRLYGENFMSALPESARAPFSEGNVIAQADIHNFNLFMFRTGYGRSVLLPVLGMLFGLVLVIQAVFFLCAVFFLGLSRMNSSPLSFRDRFGLAVFSSTLPALACSLFGLFLPTVHIIVFYFIIIFFIFQRSALCPNG
jgi:hypothetical protein